jgi:hypothetical protein
MDYQSVVFEHASVSRQGSVDVPELRVPVERARENGRFRFNDLLHRGPCRFGPARLANFR